MRRSATAVFALLILWSPCWCFGETTWWSFQPVRKPSLPEADCHPVDHFIGKKLEESGLTFSPEADRRTLIRRLYLTMLGVPPEPEAVKSFLDDQHPDAWGQLVDRVLADPRYGERWAQHWLDVIRWAETVGFETNAPRLNAWPYRDWVIRSLNEDKPYDRFILEQIAGDVVSEDAALGFLVSGPANLPGQIGRDEEAMRGARQDELDEVLRTVGQSMMGLTIGCARCHDHKFDPITSRDYYGMQAIFAGLRYGERRWRGEENDRWTNQVPEARGEVTSLESRLQGLQEQHQLEQPVQDRHEEVFPVVTTDAIRMEIRATDNRSAASLYEFEIFGADSPSMNLALASAGGKADASGFQLANQTRHHDNLIDGTVDARQAFPWVCDKTGPAWIEIELPEPTAINRTIFTRGRSVPVDYTILARKTDGSWTGLVDSGNRMLRLSDARPANEVSIPDLTPGEISELVETNARLRSAKAKLARLSAGPQVYAASFTEPETTYHLPRGDAMQRAEKLGPSIPAVLGKLALSPESNEQSRRLAFTRHLTSGDHPLTPRVMVNRCWHHYFGTGLVETTSDFGKMGRPPSHPDLLDWLAAELVEKGWSLKQLHRLVLTSATFRQSNRPNSRALEIDANSRLLWRFPPRRVEAEVIRDTILTASGKLNRKAGGVSFDLFKEKGGLSGYNPLETFTEEGWKRMIYARKIRMQSVGVFGAFDCPDAGQMTPQRTRSITPLQALSLMNSPFAIRQAGFMAERLRNHSNSLEEQIAEAFELALNREPTPSEFERLEELAGNHGLEQVCRVLFNTSEFVTLP